MEALQIPGTFRNRVQTHDLCCRSWTCTVSAPATSKQAQSLSLDLAVSWRINMCKSWRTSNTRGLLVVSTTVLTMATYFSWTSFRPRYFELISRTFACPKKTNVHTWTHNSPLLLCSVPTITILREPKKTKDVAFSENRVSQPFYLSPFATWPSGSVALRRRHSFAWA